MLGTFIGGKSFFDSFKKGLFTVSIIVLVLTLFYFIAELGDILRSKTNFEAWILGIQEQGLSYLTKAEPYYLFFFLFGAYGVFIGKLNNNQKDLKGGLSCISLAFIIFGYSAENLKTYTSLFILILLVLMGIFCFWIYLAIIRKKEKIFGYSLNGPSNDSFGLKTLPYFGFLYILLGFIQFYLIFFQ
jgi:hypothetical protein